MTLRYPQMLRFAGALLGAFLLFGGPAAAQQSILQGGTWTSGHFPVYAGSSSSYPVVIDSGAAPAIIGTGASGNLPYYATSGTTLSANTNLNINAGALTLGVAGSTKGSLLLTGSGSGTISLLPQAAAGTYNWNFPITAGTSGYPLLSGGGGSSAMTWGLLSGNTSTFATVSGALTNGHCPIADASGNLVDSGSGCSGSGTVNSGTAGQFSYYAGTGTAVSGSSVLSVSGGNVSDTGTFTSAGLTSTAAVSLSPANANVTASPTGTGTVVINPATLGTIDNMTLGGTTAAAGTFTTVLGKNSLSAGVAGVSLGSINLSGNTSGTITEKPQAAAGTYNWNLPITAGTNGQPLISGGGGTTAMSWGSLSGNTSSFATTNGALTNGHCVNIDASGNFQDAGAACATGSGTVNSGTSGQLTYYASSTNAVSGNADANISGGALTLGVANSVQGSVILEGSSSGAISLKPQAAAGTYNFNFPTTAGTSGQPLISAGGGASPMTFGTLTGNTTKFGTATGSFTSGNCITSDASGNLIDNGSPCGTGGSGTVVGSTANQIAYYPSSTASVSGNSNHTVLTSASVTTVTTGTAGATTGVLAVTGLTSGTISIKPQSAAGTYEFDLPTTAGSSGQVLTSAGGAGAPMTWTTTGLTWNDSYQTVSFNASSNNAYCIDTATTGAVTATLPASPTAGDQIQFTDCKANFALVNFTVARNGKNIVGSASNLVVDVNYASLILRYDGANNNWVLQ